MPDLTTLTIRFSVDGSDKDLIDALLPYADAKATGGMSGRAKVLMRRALGLPEPGVEKPLDEGVLRRVLREELSRVRLAGAPEEKQETNTMRGAVDEA